MTNNTLETGLFLDLKIQKWLERYFGIPADQLSVIDDLHGSEYVAVFSQISMTTVPLNTRTLVVGTTEYRIKLFNYDNKYDFASILNKDNDEYTFVIRQKDIRNWNTILNKLLKTYFI